MAEKKALELIRAGSVTSFLRIIVDEAANGADPIPDYDDIVARVGGMSNRNLKGRIKNYKQSGCIYSRALLGLIEERPSRNPYQNAFKIPKEVFQNYVDWFHNIVQQNQGLSERLDELLDGEGDNIFSRGLHDDQDFQQAHTEFNNVANKQLDKSKFQICLVIMYFLKEPTSERVRRINSRNPAVFGVDNSQVNNRRWAKLLTGVLFVILVAIFISTGTGAVYHRLLEKRGWAARNNWGEGNGPIDQKGKSDIHHDAWAADTDKTQEGKGDTHYDAGAADTDKTQEGKNDIHHDAWAADTDKTHEGKNDIHHDVGAADTDKTQEGKNDIHHDAWAADTDKTHEGKNDIHHDVGAADTDKTQEGKNDIHHDVGANLTVYIDEGKGIVQIFNNMTTFFENYATRQGENHANITSLLHITIAAVVVVPLVFILVAWFAAYKFLCWQERRNENDTDTQNVDEVRNENQILGGVLHVDGDGVSMECLLQEKDEELKAVKEEKFALLKRMEEMKEKKEISIESGGDGGGDGGDSDALRQHSGKANSSQQAFPTDDVAATGTSKPAVVDSTSPIIDSTAASHPAWLQREYLRLTKQMGIEERADIAEHFDAQVLVAVLVAARVTAYTLSAPSSIWDQRKKLFARCSAKPKEAQKKQNGAGDGDVQPSVNLKRIIKDLKKNPALVNIRSANMEPLPDGYTILHAAAYAGNAEVVKYLVTEYVIPNHDDSDDRSIMDLNERDLQGRTALHVAAHQGHVEVVRELKKVYDDLEKLRSGLKNEGSSSSRDAEALVIDTSSTSASASGFAGSCAVLDLNVLTPLGCALTSTEKLAKKNKDELKEILHEEGDKSVHNGQAMGVGYITPSPRGEKGGAFFNSNSSTPSNSSTTDEECVNGIAYAAVEMAGMRVYQEDGMFCKCPLDGSPKPSSTGENEALESSAIVPATGIFGVFDGHGDGGFASKFVASNLLPNLQSHAQWSVACNEIMNCNGETGDGVAKDVFEKVYQELDDKLKNEPRNPGNGGTTAVVACVSNRNLFVANVGDSRCILVRKKAIAANVEEEVDGQKSWDMSQIEVFQMSKDHKPDLPGESARIESAGLHIHTDIIPPDDDDENGQYETIQKVKKSDRQMLGVSRAFGDHDYKSNEDLSPSEQAVVCTPDIQVQRVNSNDLFLILACDGVWDVMTNHQVGSFVSHGFNTAIADFPKDEAVEGGNILANVGNKLLVECLRMGSSDNLTAVIIALPASGSVLPSGNATS